MENSKRAARYYILEAELLHVKGMVQIYKAIDEEAFLTEYLSFPIPIHKRSGSHRRIRPKQQEKYRDLVVELICKFIDEKQARQAVQEMTATAAKLNLKDEALIDLEKRPMLHIMKHKGLCTEYIAMCDCLKAGEKRRQSAVCKRFKPLFVGPGVFKAGVN